MAAAAAAAGYFGGAPGVYPDIPEEAVAEDHRSTDHPRSIVTDKRGRQRAAERMAQAMEGCARP